MCCSTGVCGPSVDSELIRISVAVNNLKNKGLDVLPVIMIDGKVVKEKVV